MACGASGGSWATAIVKMLCENLDEVGWYMRSSYIIEHIRRNKHNPNYLSSAYFEPEQLRFAEDINEIIDYADYLIFAVPSAFLQGELDKITTSLEDKVIFSAIKGIVPESGLIVGEHFHDIMKVPFENIGVITSATHHKSKAYQNDGRSNNHNQVIFFTKKEFTLNFIFIFLCHVNSIIRQFLNSKTSESLKRYLSR